MKLVRLSLFALAVLIGMTALTGCHPAPVPTCNFNDDACIHQTMGY